MDLLIYYLFRFFTAILSLLPFRVLYIFSDIVWFFLYYFTGYRKSVVYGNLRKSFPEMTETEISHLQYGFYRHLADLLVESLKSFSMTEQDVVKRYRFHNTGFLDEIYRQGKSVLCVAGHYGNWEWAGIAGGLQLKHKPIGFYKPLSNKYIDAYVRKTRVQGRSRLASITQTAETFVANHGEPAIFYMVADQSPSSKRLAHWVRFLNQDTATLHGPEKYAVMHNLPVVFAYAKKVGRGSYDIFFTMLEEHPSETETGRITGRFMEELEKVITENPQYYLWSHRRWKLSR